MGEITESENVVLIKFKENLSDLDLENNVLLTDMQLIRWLRARDLDIKRAEQMLRNNIAWRDQCDMKNCLKRSIPESMSAEFPFEKVGFDRQGNVLVHIPYGKMDLRKGLKQFGKEMGNTMRNYYMESTFQAALANSDGKVMKRFSPIIDFKGLTYMQFSSVEVLELLLSSLQLFEQHYPELLGTGFMVNTPAVWSILWTMTKPLLHQKTQNKVVITGSDPAKITEILEKHITKDNFPEKYGGFVKLRYPEPVILNNKSDIDIESTSPSSPTNKSFLGTWFGGLSHNNN